MYKSNNPEIQRWWNRKSLEGKQVLMSLYNFSGRHDLDHVYREAQKFHKSL